jgi:ribose transport system substrate-binding protein
MRRRLNAAMALAVLLAVVALGITGCGGGSDSSSTASSGTGSGGQSEEGGGAEEGGGSSASSGVAKAEEMVAKYTKPAGVPNAGPPLKGVESLQGKKIWFVVQSTQIPYFAAVAEGAKEAAAEAGLEIEVCDGSNSPSKLSACIEQAITGGGAGVVGDGFGIELVQQAVNAVTAAGIPYVEADQIQKAGDDKIAHSWNNSFLQSELAASALIADSGGKANVLVTRHTDAPASEEFMDKGGMKVLKEDCPECTIHSINTSAAQLSQLTGQVSAELVKNPDIDRIFAEYDLDVEPIMGALQSLNKKIPIYSTTGQLAALQRIKDGSYQAADAGTDPAYVGWAAVDQLMRMMLKTKPNTEVPMPVRLFDESNVGSLELTNGAFVSGSWYGANGFQKMFLELWGK